MTPAEMRAMLVEAMKIAIDPRIIELPKINLYADYHRRLQKQAERAVTALESTLSQIGAKITVRKMLEEVDASASTEKLITILQIWDATPPTPWSRTDG